MKQKFTMSQAQFDKILEACKPVPMIALQCGTPPSQQTMANGAWVTLGKDMGFDGMTVTPVRGKPLEIMAEPTEPVKPEMSKIAQTYQIQNLLHGIYGIRYNPKEILGVVSRITMLELAHYHVKEGSDKNAGTTLADWYVENSGRGHAKIPG